MQDKTVRCQEGRIRAGEDGDAMCLQCLDAGPQISPSDRASCHLLRVAESSSKSIERCAIGGTQIRHQARIRHRLKEALVGAWFTSASVWCSRGSCP